MFGSTLGQYSLALPLKLWYFHVMWKVLFLFLFSGCAMAKAKTNYPVSDHYDGKVFFNTPQTSNKSLVQVLQWKFTSKKAIWPNHRENKVYDLKPFSESRALITWVNHATFLVQMKGLTVLTDPLYSQRASPFTYFGPKRSRAPGVAIDNLPQVDLVVVSHNHYDHLDIETLKTLSKKFDPLFFVPLGDKKLLESVGIAKVKELDWYQTENVNGVPVQFLPSQHWSARWLNDKNESLWGSYMIGKEFKIYFAGDTGYGPHFQKIREKVGAPNVALLPIGAYEPRWFMKEHHMNPDDAAMAHKDLGAQQSIGMHFGTVQLTDEDIDAPIEALKEAKSKHQLGEKEFLTLDIGESLSL